MVEVMVLISKSYYDELVAIKERIKSEEKVLEKTKENQHDQVEKLKGQKGSGCEPPPVDEIPDVPPYKKSQFDDLFLSKELFMKSIPDKFVKRQRKKASIIAETIYASPDFEVLQDQSFKYKGHHISQGNIFNLIRSFLYGSQRLQLGQKEFMEFLKDENLLHLRKDILRAAEKRRQNTTEKPQASKLQKLEFYPKWYCIDG